MEGAMKNARYTQYLSIDSRIDEGSRDGATHRVFQTLPRHMRRRAASHDHRRVPKPHRERARTEVNA